MLESSATLPRCVGVRAKDQDYPISNAVSRPGIEDPHSVGSERQVLARLITRPDFRPPLEPSLFYWPAHRRIFTAIKELEAEGRPVDLVTLTEQLDLKEIGGPGYLAALTDEIVLEPEKHVVQLQELAHRRRLLRQTNELRVAAIEGDQAELGRLTREIGTEAAPTSKPLLTFTSASDLPRLRTRWTIKDFIEAGSFATMFGPPESMKTFVALDMGLSIATGQDWHGRVVQAGPVLYICGEGRRGIGRRLQAWERYHGVTADKFFVSSTSAQLLDEASLAELEAAADEVALQHGTPVLMIIDTLNRNFGPGDENSTNDMTKFIAALDRLRDRLQCAVLVVHHTGLVDSGRGRGNSALRGALDFEFQVTRHPVTAADDLLIEIICTKCKDHDRPPPIAFKPVVVNLGLVDDERRPITSLVLERSERNAQHRNKPLTKPQQQAVASFWKAAEATPTLDIDGNFQGLREKDWRSAFYEISTAASLEAKKKAFQRQRNILKNLGLLIVLNDLYRLATPESRAREQQIETAFSRGRGTHTAGHFDPGDQQAKKEAGELPGTSTRRQARCWKPPATTSPKGKTGQRDIAGQQRDMSRSGTGTSGTPHKGVSRVSRCDLPGPAGR